MCRDIKQIVGFRYFNVYGPRETHKGRMASVAFHNFNQFRAEGKVGLISGGGSGHEPMHGGFVGPGMLDAACCGEVFTSPVPDQMMAATKAVDGGAGVLHIVKNYTGDVMNFEMAAEMAADESGVRVESVITDDDSGPRSGGPPERQLLSRGHRAGGVGDGDRIATRHRKEESANRGAQREP